MGHRRKGWRATALLGLAFTLVAAGCASDDDGGDEAGGGGGGGGGQTVTIFGPEVEGEAQGLVDAFADFEEESGITIRYQGDRSFEEQIGVRVDGGNPPDIAYVPQPGLLKTLVSDTKKVV